MLLTRFTEIPVGKHFYASNNKGCSFKKVSKTGWRVLIRHKNGYMKTRIHRTKPEEMVLINFQF